MLRECLVLHVLAVTALWIAPLADAAGAAESANAFVNPTRPFKDNLRSLLSAPDAGRTRHSDELMVAHPIQCDWVCQDTQADIKNFLTQSHPEDLLRSMISRVTHELRTDSQLSRQALDNLQKTEPNLKALLDAYITLCEHRRAMRLRTLRATYPQIVFFKYIEQGNAPRGPMSLSRGPHKGKPFEPGSSICLLDLSDLYGRVVTLLHDANGMLRDPDVSYDGRRILFSWKRSQLEDDYHLYEMTVEDRSIRRITSEPGVADIQGRYLPDGIVYHSSRCTNVVVCNETIDTVNLYRCDPDGDNIRRLTYDQVSTQFPSVLQDGRIIYTRWEYNDRGQIFPQGLFAMNPDGTAQAAVYGNNSWYPTSIIQARGVPASNKLIAVLAGHHTPPCGKLALIDVNKGQDEGNGVQLVAPRRPIEYARKDAACQDDVLFQHPYPLSEDEYLVGFSLFGRKKSRDFGIYHMHSDGRRELLAWDSDRTCRQPIPLAPRQAPQLRPNLAASEKNTGIFYVDNIYAGRGLAGVPKGTIKRLRVIGLDFRAAAVGISFNNGPAGSARVDTPISIGGAWDTKTVLGDAEVYEDGSASFIVPARKAVYFQAIDENGRAVQSMRSWATLQGGEKLSCIGCHEDRNRAPRTARSSTIAQKVGPKKLMPFYGQARGFSFLKEIQPIFDRHCIRCHNDRPYEPPVMAAKKETAPALYCWWPARYSRTDTKQALYHLPKKQLVGSVAIQWLASAAKAAKNPTGWKLFYRNQNHWVRLHGKSEDDAFVLAEPVRTDALKVAVVLARNTAGGIERWRVYGPDGQPIEADAPTTNLNLSQAKVYEYLSARAWAQSYLSLLQAGFRKQGSIGYHLAAYPNEYLHWISPQSGPAVMSPYSFGAAKSGLISMLEAGHEEVTLSKEEMDKLCCWIDLAVPYCGKYPESGIWTDQDIRTYDRQLAERTRLSKLETRH